MATTDKFILAAPLWTGTLGSGGIADDTLTSFNLSSATGLTDGEVYVFTIDRVDANGTATPAKREVIIGELNTLAVSNCLRGQEGAAQSHVAGAVIEILMTAKQWNRMIEGLLVEHNETGTHKPTAWVTATDGATVTFNLTSGTKQKVTLGGNRTLALSNVVSGHVFILKLIQDDAGSRTVTWFSTISWAGGSAPTLTTTLNKADVFGFIQTGSNTYDGFIIGQNV